MNDYMSSYEPIGDICAIAICIINYLLLRSSYTEKNKNLKLFYALNICACIAATFSIIYHRILDSGVGYPAWQIYLCKDIFYITLACIILIYSLYLRNVSHANEKACKFITYVSWGLWIVYVILQITVPWNHFGIWIDQNGEIVPRATPGVFFYYYVLACLVIVLIIKFSWRHFITKVRICIIQVMSLSFAIMTVQMLCNHVSFTCVTFTFPILAALFLFHYNPYDSETGTLDNHAFESYVKEMNHKRFGLICLQLKDLTPKKLENMKEHFYHLTEQFFVDNCTFRLTADMITLLYPKAKNPNEEKQKKLILEEFYNLYDVYQMDYKVIMSDSCSEIPSGRQYVGLLKMVASKMSWNSVHACDEKDIKKYCRQMIIGEALQDIYNKQDLDDERVKVFCQPVLNTVTSKFTTAEALMRIVLPEEGMLFPDEFIPIAEHNGYIHTLSKIILNKTCKQICSLEKAGYQIDRVSVNFSMTELREPNFCSDVLSIIQSNHLQNDKIAIELTESRNEEDFELVQRIMRQLHAAGIKFYLDDFGTGYSNFAKIIGLPFDIIKFDRSLTIMAGKDEQSRYMVGSFSDIFDNSSYQILFEGVEDESDENSCKDMNALYLQGYKYSKPIPIEKLDGFLEKKK